MEIGVVSWQAIQMSIQAGHHRQTPARGGSGAVNYKLDQASLWRMGYSCINTRHSSIVGSMLVQRLRRWPNIDPPMDGCLKDSDIWDEPGYPWAHNPRWLGGQCSFQASGQVKWLALSPGLGRHDLWIMRPRIWEVGDVLSPIIFDKEGVLTRTTIVRKEKKNTRFSLVAWPCVGCGNLSHYLYNRFYDRIDTLKKYP